jgi:DNA-binding response OmpR family regulator
MPVKVLVLDDEPMVLRATTKFLQSEGFDVTSATSPDEVPLTERYAVGVFDLNLGNVDSVRLARTMLAANRIGGAVFFSGGGQSLVQERAAQVGTIVLKPRLAPLSETVRRLSSRPPNLTEDD